MLSEEEISRDWVAQVVLFHELTDVEFGTTRRLWHVDPPENTNYASSDIFPIILRLYYKTIQEMSQSK